MNDFVRCNKLSGVYWLKEPVDNITIRIKLKPPDDILSLPKFEDFTNESNGINLESTIEEYTFKWQEKRFSASEIQRYSDVHNCISETELQYHEVLKNTVIIPSKVFSYIHDDYYKPLPLDGIIKLNSKFECLSLNVGKIEQNLSGKSLSMRHLFTSEENVQLNEKWCAMHIVLDSSDYNEEAQLLLKKETTLISLYYNVLNKYIILTPDVNNLESNPYIVNDDAPLGHKYEVAVDLYETENCEDLIVLLRNLQKKLDKKYKKVHNFITPSFGKVYYNVCIEIMSAEAFEGDNLYIEYHIKLAEGLECKNALKGRTHTSEPMNNDDKNCHFNHFIDLDIETHIGEEPSPIIIYLEIISVDWWCRHRTEGYTHLPIDLNPGVYTEKLYSIRPEEPGGEERRFFVGGCHLLRDLEVLRSDELQNTNATYKSSGSVVIRYNIIRQSSIQSSVPTTTAPTTATALLMGAETALRKYKKARARLAAATKNINISNGEGDSIKEIN